MFNRGAVTQSLWNNGGAVTQSLRNNRGAVTQSLLPCELDRVCCTRASASVVRDFNVCVLTNQDLIRQQHFHERSCSTFNLTKFSFSRVQVPRYTASHSPFSNQKGLPFLPLRSLMAVTRGGRQVGQTRTKKGLSFLPLRSLMAVTRGGRQVGQRTPFLRASFPFLSPSVDRARSGHVKRAALFLLVPFFPSVARGRRSRQRTRANANP
jgi:hypothetical protein